MPDVAFCGFWEMVMNKLDNNIKVDLILRVKIDDDIIVTYPKLITFNKYSLLYIASYNKLLLLNNNKLI